MPPPRGRVGSLFVDMICISQILGDSQNFTSITEIFISNSRGITTICGSRFFRGREWSM
jgi:hypothetical protein